MTTLFSYVVRYDTGASPNPFGGVCTLVICKPVIRRTAAVGDWVVGIGSRGSVLGDMGGRVVYAMKVGRKLTMSEYDAWARAKCPVKVPNLQSRSRRKAVGDAVYDFAGHGPPRLLPGVHDESHRERDLSGRYALLGEQFVYFGRSAPALPARLMGIVWQGQGHRAVRDPAPVRRFEAWLAGLGQAWGTVVDDPAIWPPVIEERCSPQPCPGRPPSTAVRLARRLAH